MRTIRRIALRVFLFLLGIIGLAYGADDLWARFRKRPVEQVKVDRIFADINQWNQLEYSIGTPITDTCVDALFPHFGYTPCWYMKRHPIRQIGP